MKLNLLAVVFLTGMCTAAFADNPKNPDPPPSPCAECDSDGYERKKLHFYTPVNPKDERTSAGARAKVEISYGDPPQAVGGRTLCLQYRPSEKNQWAFFASGGGDRDVYANPDDELDFTTYH